VDSAIVAIAIAALSGALTIANTVYTSRVSRRIAEQERTASKAERLEELMSRYRDPLLHSAFDLQSRIWNIVEKGFLEIYYNGDREDARKYARDNTLYVFGEYLGWWSCSDVRSAFSIWATMRAMPPGRAGSTRCDVRC